jgi:hypothetical protein
MVESGNALRVRSRFETRSGSVQLDALTAAGCTVARSKEVSRTTADGVRTALLECMKARPW